MNEHTVPALQRAVCVEHGLPLRAIEVRIGMVVFAHRVRTPRHAPRRQHCHASAPAVVDHGGVARGGRVGMAPVGMVVNVVQLGLDDRRREPELRSADGGLDAEIVLQETLHLRPVGAFRVEQELEERASLFGRERLVRTRKGSVPIETPPAAPVVPQLRERIGVERAHLVERARKVHVEERILVVDLHDRHGGVVYVVQSRVRVHVQEQFPRIVLLGGHQARIEQVHALVHERRTFRKAVLRVEPPRHMEVHVHENAPPLELRH